MEKKELKNRKSALKGAIIGIACAICMFATAQGLTAQTIQLKGGSCVVDTVVEIPSKFVNKNVRVEFKYAFEEDATIKDLMPLFKEGYFALGKTKYEATGIVFDSQTMEIEKTGKVSLTLQVPNATKVANLKFVFNKQEVSLKNIKK